MALLYLVLCLGALTTVYPFAVMLSTGFKGPTDQNDGKLVPSFWSDDEALLAKYVDDKYSGDVSMLASTRIGVEARGPTVEAYHDFLMGLPLEHWAAGFRTAPNQVTGRLTKRWQDWIRRRYGRIEDLNRQYIELNSSFQSVAPPSEAWERKGWKPSDDAKWKDWTEFKSELPWEFRIPIREERMYQEFLRARFRNRIGSVPEAVRAGASAFEQIALAANPLLEEFRASTRPPQFAAATVEQEWKKWGEGPLPIAAAEKAHVREHRAVVSNEFTARNFVYIIDYIAVNGRALLNTVIFCGLAILGQLIVNPLAAYALSRFPMRSTGRVLLFLLATMAFPAEVAMIPSFLLLKDLGLLNTFAALVLPTLASGYSIFLLKGFFDSQPREVFDSGQVDGAPEWVMMLRLALPLAKPVLGYMALLAFIGAYGAFLYAFLVCQDSRMWTLMVFVYQLQQSAPKAVTMAAVTIAAIPSVIVFLLAQRVIMRGIVLPDER